MTKGQMWMMLVLADALVLGFVGWVVVIGYSIVTGVG
jgi:hypothetical protein